MSESAKHSGEHHAKGEKLNLDQESKANLDRLREKAEKAAEASHEEVQHIQKKVETHAVSGKEFTVGEKETTRNSSSHQYDQKAIKKDTYKKTMRHVRTRLSKPEKTFSKVVHNKTVESISEVGGKTVARPSGILGGGICALLGSVFLVYMTKHYGFEYNYLLFFILFIGGFFIGMIGELLIRSVLRKT
jgi:hypothetical protein